MCPDSVKIGFNNLPTKIRSVNIAARQAVKSEMLTITIINRLQKVSMQPEMATLMLRVDCEPRKPVTANQFQKLFSSGQNVSLSQSLLTRLCC